MKLSARLFSRPQNIDQLKICPHHRETLGLGWKRSSTRCDVPALLSSNSAKVKNRPRAERGLTKLASQTVLNPLNPRAFCKKRGFLDILVLSRLNLGQITFNAVKNALASQQLGFLATSIAMCDVLSRACAEIKILR